MKLHHAIVISAAASAFALPPKNPNRLPHPQVPLEYAELVASAPIADKSEKFLVETGPGEAKWITEADKLALLRV
jgi:hypothetical protein